MLHSAACLLQYENRWVMQEIMDLRPSELDTGGHKGSSAFKLTYRTCSGILHLQHFPSGNCTQMLQS